MIKGLYTVWCQASDMDRSVKFYRDVLGIECKFASPHWSEFNLGNCNLGLHPQLENQTPPLGIYGKGWFLGIETDDIRKLHTTLTDNGVKIQGGFHDIPGGVVLDFEDPDGNTIEAYQAGISEKDLA